jgi:hypothetical protein
MWPDERDLASELASAGAAARRGHAVDERADPAFAAGLRDELLASFPAAAPARTRWTFGDLFRGWRLAPTLAGALLIIAAGAAARTVLVGQDPTPVPTPPPSMPAVIVGELDGRVATPTASPTPSPSPTHTPSPTPSPTPTPTPSPTPMPTPVPTPVPTIKPTPQPTAKPTPAPTIGAMALTASGCNGGAVLEWSKVADSRFHHYTTLRSASSSIPAAYPPQGGAIEVGGTFTKDPHAISAVDPSAPAGSTVHYRTLAFDAENRVIAVSPVRAAVAKPLASLGTLTALDIEPGKTTFGWAPYGGPGACFTYYKLVASQSDTTPSYLEGSTAWAAIGDQGAVSTTVEGIASGTTWYVRVQAIRATALGKMVVGQGTVLTWTAP